MGNIIGFGASVGTLKVICFSATFSAITGIILGLIVILLITIAGFLIFRYFINDSRDYIDEDRTLTNSKGISRKKIE